MALRLPREASRTRATASAASPTATAARSQLPFPCARSTRNAPPIPCSRSRTPSHATRAEAMPMAT
jgi:hypothetical protein